MPWIDGHLDLAFMALDGRDLRKPCEDPDQACISLPALREAGVDLVFATIFSAPGELPEADAEGWEHPCRYPSSDDLDAAEQAGLCQIELYRQLEEAGVDLVFATIFSAPGEIPEANAEGWEHPGVCVPPAYIPLFSRFPHFVRASWRAGR